MLWRLSVLLLTLVTIVRGIGNPLSMKARKMTAHLPVSNNEFVSVFMGSEPGRMMTLRIEREQNETVKLFQVPSEHTSRTFIQYDQEGREGNEIIFIGSHSMRVRVVVDPFSQRTDTRVVHGGSLGLGKGSELWRYWSRFTLSSTDLILGANDRSLERGNFKFFELHMGPNKVIETPMRATVGVKKKAKASSREKSRAEEMMPEGRGLKIQFQPNEMHTSVPSDVFFELMNSTEHRENRVPPLMLHFLSEDSRPIDVEIRDKESMFKRNPKQQEDQVILGCSACRDFVWHIDRLRDTYVLAPSYDAFDLGNSQPWFNIVASLLFILKYYFWYAIVYIEHVKNRNRQSFVLSTLEMYGYIASVAFFVIMDRGFEIKRFVDFQVSYTHLASYEFLVVLLLVTLGIGATLAFFTFNTPRHLTIRKILFELTLTLCFWLTQIETHYSGLQQIFLVALASIHSIVRTVSFLWCIGENEPVETHKVGAVVVGALISHWFLLFFNIIPFVSRYWYGFPAQWSSVLLVWLVCSGMPSLLVFFSLISSEIANDFIQLDASNKRQD